MMDFLLAVLKTSMFLVSAIYDWKLAFYWTISNVKI